MGHEIRIDEHIQISREELLALLRGKTQRVAMRPKNGSTTFSASLTLRVSDEMTSAERARAVDALTSARRASHLDGWTVRPDGFATPVPGSTAWIAFLATNSDRIMVHDANGVLVPLRDLPADAQATLIEGWLVNGTTPEPAPGVNAILARVREGDEQRAVNAVPRGPDDVSMETLSNPEVKGRSEGIDFSKLAAESRARRAAAEPPPPPPAPRYEPPTPRCSGDCTRGGDGPPCGLPGCWTYDDGAGIGGPRR